MGRLSIGRCRGRGGRDSVVEEARPRGPLSTPRATRGLGADRDDAAHDGYEAAGERAGDRLLARAVRSRTPTSGSRTRARSRLSRPGKDGVARADSLEPGTWSISASADGHEPAAASSRELRAGETTKIDIQLAPGGRTLVGLVTDASGGPIAGARIDAAKLGGLARPSDAVATHVDRRRRTLQAAGRGGPADRRRERAELRAAISIRRGRRGRRRPRTSSSFPAA